MKSTLQRRKLADCVHSSCEMTVSICPEFFMFMLFRSLLTCSIVIMVLAPLYAELPAGSYLPRRIVQPGSIANPAFQFINQTQVKPGSQEKLAANIVRPRPGTYPSIIEDKTIVAYYGNPHSRYMGILGETTVDLAIKGVKETARLYDNANGNDGVIPAFHLIYGTVHADAGVGILSDDRILQYVQAAQANGMVVVLDHQLGKYDVASCVKRMLPWLHYPNVHLAIDPEWATTKPGSEIGSIDASDVNNAMQLIQDYMIKNNINSRKLFVVHQFQYRMLRNREKIRTDFDRIDFILNADGFGPPQLKLDTYRYVAAATNMPMKGFKLFFPKPWKSEGFDKPLMSPQEVMDLNPRPIFINYQ